jgi:gluconolactonase
MSAAFDKLGCEKLADGFQFTEGPLWDASDRSLLFSDIPGDRIHRWRAGAAVETFRHPSHMANGLASDRQGRLIACEHATSRVTRTEPDGRITILASHYDGKELNSPNDVAVGRDGAIYFTDPDYGRREYYGVPRTPQLAFRGVYRIAPDGLGLTLLADDFAQPNGLCLSLDETRLFVNDTERGHVRVFDLRPDGSVSGGKVWAEPSGSDPGAPDGMKTDSQDRLYCTGPGGIHVFDSAARLLGVIRVPETPANFTFGGDDLRTLFITATHGLYAAAVDVPGRG